MASTYDRNDGDNAKRLQQWRGLHHPHVLSADNNLWQQSGYKAGRQPNAKAVVGVDVDMDG